MEEYRELKGIITAMVTPFDEHEELDIEAAKRMARWLINKGVHGLFIAGTNGEFHLLSDDEIVELTKAVVAEVNGEVPVVAGGGRCSTKQTIALCNRLKDSGADFISVVSPYYLVPSQTDLQLHYEKIAAAVDAPLLLYNIPGQTGINIDPAIVEHLADIKNIVGIKDSSGNIENQKAYVDIAKRKDFVVLNGSDSLMLSMFKEGAVASVAATSNVIPEIEVKLYEDFCKGDYDAAQKQRDLMDELRMNLKKATAPSIMKRCLNLMGVYAGITRSPVQTPKLDQEIEKMITYYNIKEK